jgi:hypothetical protein
MLWGFQIWAAKDTWSLCDRQNSSLIKKSSCTNFVMYCQQEKYQASCTLIIKVTCHEWKFMKYTRVDACINGNSQVYLNSWKIAFVMKHFLKTLYLNNITSQLCVCVCVCVYIYMLSIELYLLDACINGKIWEDAKRFWWFPMEIFVFEGSVVVQSRACFLFNFLDSILRFFPLIFYFFFAKEQIIYYSQSLYIVQDMSQI